jgi:hypothetical protein
LKPWEHEHAFSAETGGSAERRTRWVVGVTVLMMLGEIVAGVAFGSMALLADGWHMGTHAAALSVAVFAYGTRGAMRPTSVQLRKRQGRGWADSRARSASQWWPYLSSERVSPA